MICSCKPKLSPQQIAHARKLIEGGESPARVAQLLGVARSTLYVVLWARFRPYRTSFMINNDYPSAFEELQFEKLYEDSKDNWRIKGTQFELFCFSRGIMSDELVPSKAPYDKRSVRYHEFDVKEFARVQ